MSRITSSTEGYQTRPGCLWIEEPKFYNYDERFKVHLSISALEINKDANRRYRRCKLSSMEEKKSNTT
jgi:hypothetical protein